jgi:hypothetical protein
LQNLKAMARKGKMLGKLLSTYQCRSLQGWPP